MRRDVKEVLGVLMQVVGGGDVSLEDVMDLGFEADDDLEAAVNEAYIKLLEFAYDREARLSNPRLDGDMRAELKICLGRIAKVAD